MNEHDHQGLDEARGGAWLSQVALIAQLALGCVGCTASGSRPPEAEPGAGRSPAEVAAATASDTTAPDEPGRLEVAKDETPATTTAPHKPPGDPAPEMFYQAQIEDTALAGTHTVRHLDWTCKDGTCTAMGPKLNVSGKSCVSLGAVLGTVVTGFTYGNESLDGKHMDYCRRTLAKLKAAGKFEEVAKRRDATDKAPKHLAEGETYVEITVFDGQTPLRGGDLRFVLHSGEVVLLRPDGGVYRFDLERRVLDSGRFVRWHSVRGYYTSEQVMAPAILERCSRTNGGTRIKPWEIRAASSRIAACSPHREDFRLVFARQSAPADAQADARRAAFEAPFSDDTAWPRLTKRLVPRSSEVVVGSAQSRPGYHGAPAKQMLESVRDTIQACFSELLPKQPKLEGQGELVLALNAFGRPRTAVVRRHAYPNAERLNACIEQRVMQLSLQSTFDVTIYIPFDLFPR